MDDSITISRPVDYHILDQCREVEKAAWELERFDGETTPAHLLITIQRHNTGDVLVAQHGEQVVGFLYGFVGLADDDRYRLTGNSMLYASHQMGIRPDYQGRGIGHQLKLEQRELAIKRLFKLVVWTHDPLQRVNAHLNINKLGAICRHYKRDYYGELQGINAGLPTDRFEVEWWIKSERVEQHIGQAYHPPDLNAWLKAGAIQVNPSVNYRDGLRAPADSAGIPKKAHALLIEIPGSIKALKKADMGLAQTWQAQVRTAFETAFDTGYVVTHFLREGDRGFYVLLHDFDMHTLAGD